MKQQWNRLDDERPMWRHEVTGHVVVVEKRSTPPFTGFQVLLRTDERGDGFEVALSSSEREAFERAERYMERHPTVDELPVNGEAAGTSAPSSVNL